MNFDEIKHHARIVYQRVSNVTTFVLMLVYLWGCLVAGKPLSLKNYASYVDHSFQWSSEPTKKPTTTCESSFEVTMMPEKLISFRDYLQERAKAEAERQLTPDVHVRSQPEIERQPSYFRKTLELEGRSNWSGGNWGGRAR